jgi:serine/threonine-protein kinase
MTTSGQAGALIAGRYRLERPTGGGTWPEEIWQGFDETLGRSVMLRLLPVDEQVEADVEEQAHSVVAQVARLGHPNIAQVYDVGQEDGLRYVVSEWTGGRTLGQIMATGRQRWQRAADWGQQIAGALAALHSVGLVDGVLGPETVSVLDDRRVKLTDVGLGVAQEPGARPPGPDEQATRLIPPGTGGGPDSEQTRVVPPGASGASGAPGQSGGTGGTGAQADEEETRLIPPSPAHGADAEPTRVAPPYGVPGQHAPSGAAADVYALAAILWTAMVGRPPQVDPADLQGPDTAPLHAIGAPDDLARLLRSMLAASEQVRPSAGVAANRFAALALEAKERSDTLPTAMVAQPTQALGDPMRARPVTAPIPRQAEQPPGHGRAWAVAIALVLLLAGAALALALALNHDRTPGPTITQTPLPPNSSANLVTLTAEASTTSAAPSSSAPTSASPSPSASPSASPSPSPSPSASPSPSPSPSQVTSPAAEGSASSSTQAALGSPPAQTAAVQSR